ncbi:cysteine hydrolase family protein [Marininema halotolerans]|uniref:Nicotinamidase-related amidase n=1 Tax=Marininema halotolerans TaxID=1155944 RepID=A0A1I6R327_9BACL|nr:isochorismatase family cysteine hydrolase [Marininema halotolerans]SFS59151.1 Nicotinamidase-related amidase [Marininema halotolerans]
MKKALLVLDLINDIVHEDGSVSKDGFYDQVQQRQVIANTARAIDHCRQEDIPVIYVIFGYSDGYPEWSEQPKLFRNVKSRQQVLLGTWATQVHDDLQPLPNDVIITKHRIDPFFNTNLDIVLRSMNIDTLYLTGVSTDFVVLSTVLSGHDRGYGIRPLEDCIASSDSYSHECAMTVINKLSDVYSVEQFINHGI